MQNVTRIYLNSNKTDQILRTFGSADGELIRATRFVVVIVKLLVF